MKKGYNHRLYGRRILHIMSPVRWKGSKHIVHADSNYKVMAKTIKWLPMCHHTILTPENHTIPDLGENVTLVPFPYAQSVLFNRGFFHGRHLVKHTDWRAKDFDFVFNHQPELLYNVYNALLTGRYGMSVDSFNFFHWVDCAKSRPTGGYPVGFFRQLEAIDLSYRSYFHCPVSLDYMKSNWDKNDHTTKGVDEKVMKEKINYFPLGVGDLPDPEPFPLPDKKILVFNHRWNNTTGIKKLIKFTEDLDRDEWLVWVTDDEAKKPKAGAPAPDWMMVKNLPSGGNYRYLLDKCFASLCFVDDYMTWNLSAQDAIKVGRPSLTYKHDTHEYVLGKDYPLYFKDKKSFKEMLDNMSVGQTLDWTLPEHDKQFKENLLSDLTNALDSKKKKVNSTKSGVEWLYHILQGNGYKKNLLHNSHPNLFLSNSWEKIRLWCMGKGVLDDPTKEFTRLWIPDEKRDEIQKIVDDAGGLGENGKKLEHSLKDPTFNDKENQWW